MSGLPIYEDLKLRRIYNPAYISGDVAWAGANHITFKLIVCLEAIRDLTTEMNLLRLVASPNLSSREIKRLAVPTHSFALAVKSIFGEFEGNAKAYQLERESRSVIANWKKIFDVVIASNGNIKLIRDKIGAHLDLNAVNSPDVAWDAVGLDQFLTVIKECIIQIENFLLLEVFAWWLDDNDTELMKLMSVDGILVHLSKEPDERLVAVTYAVSPKVAIRQEIGELLRLTNEFQALV